MLFIASKADKEQQLDITGDIGEEMPSNENFGDKVLENVAKQFVTQFQLNQSSISKEMLKRNKLLENCSDIAVPSMNGMVQDMKNVESIWWHNTIFITCKHTYCEQLQL